MCVGVHAVGFALSVVGAWFWVPCVVHLNNIVINTVEQPLPLMGGVEQKYLLGKRYSRDLLATIGDSKPRSVCSCSSTDKERQERCKSGARG